MSYPDRSRVNILGVNISAVNMPDALESIKEWIRLGDKKYVCVAPAHSVMDCFHDPSLRSIFNASGMTTPDGMGIVWLLRLKGQSHVRRVYGPDLMLSVCEKSIEMGWRHFLYGGATGVATKLADELGVRFPGIKIVGTYSPPFRPLTPDEDQAIVKYINSTGPDILWVGISAPKQERWMADHMSFLNAHVLVGVGAAFDFLSGTKKQAPRWIQSSGFEWLFRLISEPRRLWRRYIQYPRFILLVLAQALGIKRYPIQ